MSERDFFDKFGTAAAGRPQPDSEPPQQYPDSGQHRRAGRPDDDPEGNTPARGLPLRELHSGPQPPVSEFPRRAPEFEPAAAETGEQGEPDELTVDYVREARTVPPQPPAPHRQPEVGAPWSPPPPAP